MTLDEALTCADGHLKDYSSTPAEITLAAEVRRLREENERMEKAEAELAKLRGQKPVVFLPENWRPTRGGGVVGSVFSDGHFKVPLYAAPTPAPSPDCTEVLTRPLQQESGKVVLDGEVLSLFDVFGGHHGKWFMTVGASLDMDAQGVLAVLKRVGYNASSVLKKHASTLDLPERTEQERQLRRDMLDIADTLQKAVAPLRDDSHLRRFPTGFDAIDRCIYRLKEGGK